MEYKRLTPQTPDKFAEHLLEEEKELTREEYFRLVNAAKAKGSERLSLPIETFCASGIRVSKLQYIAAEAVAARRSRGELQGKNSDDFHTKPIAEEAAPIYKRAKDLIRRGACHANGQAHEPK